MSARTDGRGHWPKGKTRSTLTADRRATVIRRLRRAAETESLRAIARTLGMSDRSIRRVLAGEDQPAQRMYDRARARLTERRRRSG